MPAPSSIEIRVLGSFRVAIDGETVPESRWRQRKPALLLQRLALEPNHRLHGEQLMELLWPEADAGASRNSLHKTIHMVRSALEPSLRRAADSHFLLTRGQQVILSAPLNIWIDADAFLAKAAEAMKLGDPAAFEAALALYNGPLLPEEPYEEWVVDRREQLQSTWEQLLIELARIHEQRSEPERAITVLNRLVGADPANEAGHRALMRLYAATGRRQLALRQYRECCGALRRELDTDPDPATVSVYDEIVAGRIEMESKPASRAAPLAVLPFENATGDPELDYLSDGMTESIIGTLSRIPRLHVLAHSTVSRLKGSDPRDAAQSLNAASIVTGKILQRRDRLIIRVELIDADGCRAGGAEYERPLASVVGIEEEISSAIAEQLGLTSNERTGMATRQTENAEAHRLFLRGRHIYNKRTLDAVNRSIGYLRQAIEIDSEYAPAWVGLADAYSKLGDVGVSAIPPKEAFSKARVAAIRALEIDTNLAEAHTSMAHLFMHEYEWAEAEREFRSALRLNPNNLLTHHWFSTERLLTGHTSEAFEEMGRALELDPLSVAVNCDHAYLSFYIHEFQTAIDHFQMTLELDAHYLPAHMGIGRSFVEIGRFDEARAAFLTAKELGGYRPEILAAEATIHARTGKNDGARDLERLKGIATSQYVSPYTIAVVLAALGELDEAFVWLRRGCEEQAAWSIYALVDPRLDPLREDPRFAGILQLVGLSQR